MRAGNPAGRLGSTQCQVAEAAAASASASIVSPGSEPGQRWSVRGGQGSPLRGTGPQSLLSRARRPGTRPAARGGCAPAERGCVFMVGRGEKGCRGDAAQFFPCASLAACRASTLYYPSARLSPRSSASQPPTSAGRRRSQYTSLMYISPPGASTRYTSRSTRALSGDRLICRVRQSRRVGGGVVQG